MIKTVPKTEKKHKEEQRRTSRHYVVVRLQWVTCDRIFLCQ